MHYALERSIPSAEVISAFDINTVANDVYQHNHGKRPYQVRHPEASCSQLLQAQLKALPPVL